MGPITPHGAPVITEHVLKKFDSRGPSITATIHPIRCGQIEQLILLCGYRLPSCYSPTCRQKIRPIASSSPALAMLAWSPLEQVTGETSAAANRCSTVPATGFAQAQ